MRGRKRTDEELINSDEYFKFLFDLGMCGLEWHMTAREIGERIRSMIDVSSPGFGTIVCPISAVSIFRTGLSADFHAAVWLGEELRLNRRLTHSIIAAADDYPMSRLPPRGVQREIRRDLLMATGLMKPKV
ncbi:MAG: hypothetical protein AAB389_02035 [Patescibacteria group bacterium]